MTDGTIERDDDPVARRLARSGITLPAADLAHLTDAREALDAARAAVTAAAVQARIVEARPWPLPARR